MIVKSYKNRESKKSYKEFLYFCGILKAGNAISNTLEQQISPTHSLEVCNPLRLPLTAQKYAAVFRIHMQAAMILELLVDLALIVLFFGSTQPHPHPHPHLHSHPRSPSSTHSAESQTSISC